MTTSTQAIHHQRIYEVSPTRKLVMGIIEVLIALLILLVFVRTSSPTAISTFVMTPGGIDIGAVGDWIIPTRLTLILLTSSHLPLLYQLIRGFGRAANAMVGLTGLF